MFSYHNFFKIISLKLNHLKFQLKADLQSHRNTFVHLDTISKKNIYVTLHWLNLIFWYYNTPSSSPPQKTKKLQMLDYYSDNTLKSVHYANTTWNFQAFIFLSLRDNYTAYNKQAMTCQSRAYTYTTYNLEAITFQSIRYTYTIYSLQANIFQSLCYIYTAYM